MQINEQSTTNTDGLGLKKNSISKSRVSSLKEDFEKGRRRNIE